MPTRVGLDIGRSGIKLIADTPERSNPAYLPIIPPVAVPAEPHLLDESERQQAAKDTVQLPNGTEWWIGDTAELQGRPTQANFSAWSETDEYAALLLGSLQHIESQGMAGPYHIVAGLPSEASPQDRRGLEQRISQLVNHGCRVKVIPQPAGIFFQSAVRQQELYEPHTVTLIVDIGRYTTDFAMLRGGRPIGRGLHSIEGVRQAIKALELRLRDRFSNTPPINRLEHALINGGRLRINAAEHDVNAEAQTALKSFAEGLQRRIDTILNEEGGAIDHIIVGGGGAALLANSLEELGFKVDPRNPRFRVAEGFLQAARKL